MKVLFERISMPGLAVMFILAGLWESAIASDFVSPRSLLSDNFINLNWPSSDRGGEIFPNKNEKRIPSLVMKLEHYGVIADGVTDDSAAINAALKKASQHGWSVQFPELKTTVAASPVIVPNGVPEIYGGTVSFVGKDSGFLLNGKHEGLLNNVKNLKIHDITVNIGKKGMFGIRGSNVSNVTIDNVDVNGDSLKSRAILLIAYTAGGEDSEGIIISNNRVTLPGNEKGMMGIELVSELDFGKYDGAISLWRATKTTALASYYMKGPIVHNNAIDGGYYGISLAGVLGYDVKYNIVRNNMRNISAQHRSNHGNIYSNVLRDSVSSGIHLAYGSSDNKIQFNDIETSKARGEGLIQAYVGTKRNLFEYNTVTCTSRQGAKYLAYSGIHADGNVFRNNIFKGTFSRAAIAIEPAWDHNHSSQAHRGSFRGDKSSHEWANRSIDGIVVEGNRLEVVATRKYAPEIMYSEIKDHEGTHSLKNFTIRNNFSIGGNMDHAIRVLKVGALPEIESN